MAVFEHIEKLKRDYTDKFVLVDDHCAELARFKGQTGRVRTVNMNGRALVEFDHYANIGWFDIDVDYLKVVDRPPPKKEEKKAGGGGAKPAKSKPAKATAEGAEKQLSPLEMARLQDSGGGKPASASEPVASETVANETAPAKMSTADILAAARGKKSTADSPESGSAGKDAGSPASPPKADKQADQPAGEMTLAEKLAAARGETVAPVAEETVAEETAAEANAEQAEESDDSGSTASQDEPVAADDQPAAAEGNAGEVVDRSTMTVEEMIAWCRAHDGP